MAKLASERRRDGAYDWGIYEDASKEGVFVETFHVNSWLEHMRQHQRVTNADRVLQDAVHRFPSGRRPPAVRHLIAAQGSANGMIGYGFLIARLCLAAVFLYSGVDKLTALAGEHRRGQERRTALAGSFRGRHRLYPARRRMPCRHRILRMAGRAVARRVYGRGYIGRASLLAPPRKRVRARTDDQPGACGDCRRVGLALPPRSHGQRMKDRNERPGHPAQAPRRL